MKAHVDRATTAKVLAGIDAVLRERTAAAVERVLTTASPALKIATMEGYLLTQVICRDLGIEPAAEQTHGGRCQCLADGSMDLVDIIPQLRSEVGMGEANLLNLRKAYAPWVVSPHLFGGAP